MVTWGRPGNSASLRLSPRFLPNEAMRSARQFRVPGLKFKVMVRLKTIFAKRTQPRTGKDRINKMYRMSEGGFCETKPIPIRVLGVDSWLKQKITKRSQRPDLSKKRQPRMDHTDET